MALTKQLLTEAIPRSQPLVLSLPVPQTPASVTSTPRRRPRRLTRSRRTTRPVLPSSPSTPTPLPHHTNPPSSPTSTHQASNATPRVRTVVRVQEATRCRPCSGTMGTPQATPTTRRAAAACPPSPLSSPPSPLASLTSTPTPAHQRLKTCFTTLHPSPPTRIPWKDPRRKCGRQKLVLTGCLANGSPGKERRPTSGSSFSNFSRTRTAAPSSSSGATGRRGCSSLLTVKLSPAFGVCTKTNQTWTTRQWVERWGKYKLQAC